MEVLEYTKWSNFLKVIDRAMLACDNLGIKVNDQFAEVGKLITHAKGGKRKGLKEKEKILDYMNSQELIANLFRISLADEKIKKEKVSNKDNATLIHNKVGQEVRNAIKRVGGVLPEKQPTPQKSIDEIAKEQIQKLKKKKNLFLDE